MNWFRDNNGQNIGSSQDNGAGGTDFFNSNGQRVGYENNNGTFDQNNFRVSPDEIGTNLFRK